MAAQSRGSVKVLVQPLKLSLLAIATAVFDLGDGVPGVAQMSGPRQLAFGQDLEQQFGAALVELQVAELVEAEQFDPAVASDGAGQLALVGGFDEFVDELGGQDVAHLVAGLGGGGPEPDEQVALAGAAVTDQAQDWPLATQPQPARVLIVAGLIAVFAAKSNSARVLGRGLSHSVDQVTQGAAEPVQAPHHQGVPRPQELQHLVQLRSAVQSTPDAWSPNTS